MNFVQQWAASAMISVALLLLMAALSHASSDYDVGMFVIQCAISVVVSGLLTWVLRRYAVK